MADQKEKCVLAYSGGLDTSCCIKWLQEEKNVDVIAVVGEVGQEHDGLEKVRQKALATGAIACHVVDMREDFANEYLSCALAANGLYENRYPLVSALSRPLISKHLVRIAHEYGAKYIAHGCTGKGNDQVRFETSILTLDPSLEILAPVREWDLGSRPKEIAWARERGIEVPATNDKPYSIDDNLWGRAIECGVLENPWNEPPADIYTMTTDPEAAPDEAEYVEISFEKGIPCAINGEKKSFLDIVYDLNEIAGRNGYGRLDMIENRLDTIYRIKQKFGMEVEELLVRREAAAAELENFQSSGQKIAELKTQVQALYADAKKAAEALTQSRLKGFTAMNKEMRAALEFLNMPGIRFALKHARGPLSSHGQDTVEFLISTNPGEDPKPLAKIASGGELSRIMLAFKSALADRDALPTVIYDEIDTGVSGLAAGRIGQLLHQTAAGHQVLCITHTPQVAAFADNQLLIQKNVRDDRTFTEIHTLDMNGRVEVLARMISGDKVTELSLANARELIEKSK